MKKTDKRLREAHAKLEALVAAAESENGEFSAWEFAAAYDAVEALEAKIMKKEADHTKFHSYLPKLLYSIPETAHMLSMDDKSVRRLLERGLLKSSKALRTKLITRESIENFIKTST